MKKIYTILMALLSAYITFSQTVNIPDANFKAALIAKGYDTNKDGNIQKSEVGDIIDLNISNKAIADLTGIEAFTGLFSINFSQNLLTKVDFSKNSLLTQINISNNKLDTIDLSKLAMLSSLQCDHNALKNLELAYNSSLTTLLCGNNQLTSLDVSFLNLYRFECSSNKITTLDLSYSTNLSSIICGSNSLTDTLDLSNCPDLTYIACDYNQLTGLKMKDSIKVTTLFCNNNLLTSLDVNDKIEINNLTVSGNKITELDIAPLTKLTLFSCTNNKLSSIDVSHAPNLSVFYCGINNISSLDLSQNPKLSIFACNSTKVSFLDITKNPLLTSLNTQGNALLKYICVPNVTTASNNTKFLKDAATQYTENCNVVTGLNMDKMDLNAEISPNPSEESFHITISEPSEVIVRNLDGKTENTFYNIQSLSFGHSYKAGIYLVNIKNQNSSKMIRVVKQ